MEQLEHEGLIILGQFEDFHLKPLESSDLKPMLNRVSLSAQDTSGTEPYVESKLIESSFQNFRDHLIRPSQSLDRGPTVDAYLMDSILSENVKWDLLKPKREAHLSTVSLSLEDT